MARSRKLGSILAILAILGIVAYRHRIDLVVKLAPIALRFRNPIEPHREVEWARGPDQATAAPNDRPPNIIVILADDMGFNDVSLYNGGAGDGSIQTPNIDSIGRDGVVFTNGYAANAVCAPSRASVMTGRYATRFGFEFTPFPKLGVKIGQMMADEQTSGLPIYIHHDNAENLPEMKELGMPASEITMAELVKQAGYQTAHIGKWHLGGVDGMQPEDQGFDNSLNMMGGLYLPENSPDVVNAKQENDLIDRMVWATQPYAAQFDGSASFEPKGYLTDYYTEEAVRVIEANRHRPFLLYLAHWGVHNPLQAKRSDYDALSHIKDHRLRVYSAMILALDRGIGKVLQALERHGLTENTLVIFTSDNGGAGYIGLPGVNKPYRGWKLTHFEGGLHVPFVAKWPARITPGSKYEAPVSHLDLLPTAAAAAGVGLPSDRPIDGVDLLPFVRGENREKPHRTLIWREGYYQTILHDGWKMLRSERPKKHWLFDLANDPTEQRNLAEQHPERIAELDRMLDRHNAEQVEPLWPSVSEQPILVDKTGDQPYEDGDEYTYWPN